MEEMFQVVIITLDDGTKAIFSGKAQVFEGKSKTVKAVEFSTPTELPADCSFGLMSEGLNKTVEQGAAPRPPKVGG